MIVPHGQGAKTLKAKLFNSGSKVIQSAPGSVINLTFDYEYLGSYIHHKGSIIREARRRTGIAFSTAASLQKRFFANPVIRNTTKSIIGEAIVLSKALYCSHVWPAPSRQED